jgi:hypothetical protein
VIKTYRYLFFDVGAWKRSHGRFAFSLYGRPMQGLGDDLGELWKWIGLRYGIVALDRTIAYTTGEGRENHSEMALADIGAFVESLRISVWEHPEAVIRLHHRTQVEEAGLPLSKCYRRRRRRASGAGDNASPDPSGGPVPM